MGAFRFLFLCFAFPQTKTTYKLFASVRRLLRRSLWPVAVGTNQLHTSLESQLRELVSSRVCVYTLQNDLLSPSPSPGSVSFVHQPVRGLLACPPSASQDDPDFSARLFFIMGLCKRLPSNSPTRRLAGWLMSFTVGLHKSLSALFWCAFFIQAHPSLWKTRDLVCANGLLFSFFVFFFQLMTS